MEEIKLIKKIKTTGNALAIIFNHEEKDCYNLQHDQKIRITIQKIKEIPKK